MTDSANTPEPTPEISSQQTSDVSEYPGRTLGVVALVLAFFTQLPALIMGIIAWNWSNRAGVSNTPAKAAVFVSIGIIIIGIFILVGWVALIANLSDALLDPALFEDL